MSKRDVAVLKLTRCSARVKAQPETEREKARHSCGQTQRERERGTEEVGGRRARQRETAREGGRRSGKHTLVTGFYTPWII